MQKCHAKILWNTASFSSLPSQLQVSSPACPINAEEILSLSQFAQASLTDWVSKTSKTTLLTQMANGFLRKGRFFFPALGILHFISLCTHDLILLFLIGQTEELHLQWQLSACLSLFQTIWYATNPPTLVLLSHWDVSKPETSSPTGTDTFHFCLPYSQSSTTLKLFQELCRKASSIWT